MMNRYIMPLMAAFATGGLAGFLIAQKKLGEKYSLAVEERDELLAERYHIGQNADDRDPDNFDDAEIVAGKGYSTLTDPKLSGTKTAEINNLKHVYSLTRDEGYVEATDEDDEQPPAEDDAATGETEPYVITEERFAEEMLDHDKLSWTYYAGDDVLADENDEVIDEIEGTVGWGNLDMKYTTLAHPHQVFVRNERLGIDYEITITYESYKTVVMGFEASNVYGLSPREQQAERMKRRPRGEEAEDDE